MFEITIKEIKTETKTVRGEYTTLGWHLVTEEELKPSVYGQSPHRERFLEGKEVVKMPESGYAPDVEKEVEATHEIYTQRVENLDLPAVIKAINKI